jgi:hypothetical protein
MGDSTGITLHQGHSRAPARRHLGDDPVAPPTIVTAAGGAAEFAWDEFSEGQIADAHTRKRSAHAMPGFVDWCDSLGRRIRLVRITTGRVDDYLAGLRLATSTKMLRLAALRIFVDLLVLRHFVVSIPAASVRAERYSVIEGKTPEISAKYSLDVPRSVDLSTLRGCASTP